MAIFGDIKMKINNYLLIGVLLIANKANANILQVQEARSELTHISKAKREAKLTLDKARLAYKQLDQAEDKQSHALKLLVASDRAKQLAEQASISSVNNGHNSEAYLADQAHGYGEARLILPNGS